MKVTLLNHTINPVEHIGEMAAICYDSKTDRESNIKRAAHCKDKGHLMTLRFAYATFNISGISRVCSHQLVRVAHAGILQESQRYVEQTNIEWIIPPSLESMPHQLEMNWYDLLESCERFYNLCIKSGMKKEDARYILPQSCITQLNMTGNFQMWRDLLNNRTKKPVLWETRDVAIAIQNELHKIAPEIFDAIDT